mmetsp:Transcript_2902/g.11063  ORF Transcript_2902/g.11063 Transcript_2902/m.11063 type:complete len:127 (-) Transcript_2902:89-469(-)
MPSRRLAHAQTNPREQNDEVKRNDELCNAKQREVDSKRYAEQNRSRTGDRNQMTQANIQRNKECAGTLRRQDFDIEPENEVPLGRKDAGGVNHSIYNASRRVAGRAEEPLFQNTTSELMKEGNAQQ